MSSSRDASSHLRLTRRSFILGSGVTAAALALYSGEIERHFVDVVNTTVLIQNLPSEFHGFRVVQLSDIHLDEFTEPFFLEHVVHKINQLNPDLVLITGDFITRGSLTFISSHHAAHRCAEILSTLKTPQVFAILGNHDVAVDASLVINALKAVKIPVLVNQHVSIDRGNSRIWVAGTDDINGGHPDLNLTLPDASEVPVILMAHEPDYADIVAAHPKGKRVDLMLSGHSHGGQIRVPFVGPLVLPPLGQKYVEGHFQFGQLQLYVNRGIGSVGLPFRFNCPPELTVHHLQPAQ